MLVLVQTAFYVAHISAFMQFHISDEMSYKFPSTREAFDAAAQGFEALSSEGGIKG